jgi:hypothetical protein
LQRDRRVLVARERADGGDDLERIVRRARNQRDSRPVEFSGVPGIKQVNLRLDLIPLGPVTNVLDDSQDFRR